MGDAMEIKEEFKKFVKDNPSLIKYVRDGKKTWQDFFEIYSLYGSDSSVWKEYIAVSSSADLFSFLKTIDVDSIQSGISSIQRVLGVFQDLVNKDDSSEEYQPRPVYKHFED